MVALLKIKTEIPLAMKLKFTFLFSCLFFFLNPSFSQEIQVDPPKGWQGRLMDVGISGTNTTFASATSTCGELDVSKILFHQGMTTFNPVTLNVESDFQLYTQVNIASATPTGLYDVILWAGQGACEVSCQDCFEVFPRAQIISVSPDNENINTSNIDVTISTDYSCFTQGSSTCQVNEGNVRFFQPAPNTFDFQPNSVTIVDDKTIIANIDLPNFIIVDDYNIVVAEGYPCEASCEECFEVQAASFMELISGNQSPRGESVDIELEIFFADITNCLYDETTVFLQQGNYTIIPEIIAINGQMIELEVSIPSDAPLGVYDIVVGDGLGGDCEYICEDCFTVDQGVYTSELIFSEELVISPNPNPGTFTISSSVNLFDVCLEIYDASGRQVWYQKNDRFRQQEINLNARGVYLVKLATQDTIQVKRVVVK